MWSLVECLWLKFLNVCLLTLYCGKASFATGRKYYNKVRNTVEVSEDLRS